MLTLKEDGKLFVRKNSFKVILVGCGRIAGGADGAVLKHMLVQLENQMSPCKHAGIFEGKDFGEKYACDVFIDL